jgi:hypothetical protein
VTTGTKVSLAVEQGTGRITLDGPERRDALDARVARGLAAVSRDDTGRASRLADKSGNPVETAGWKRQLGDRRSTCPSTPSRSESLCMHKVRIRVARRHERRTIAESLANRLRSARKASACTTAPGRPRSAGAVVRRI